MGFALGQHGLQPPGDKKSTAAVKGSAPARKGKK
jgi:hypothetical protein